MRAVPARAACVLATALIGVAPSAHAQEIRQRGVRAGGSVHVALIQAGGGASARLGAQVHPRVAVFGETLWMFGSTFVGTGLAMVEANPVPRMVLGAGLGAGGHFAFGGGSDPRGVFALRIGAEIPAGPVMVSFLANLHALFGGVTLPTSLQRAGETGMYWLPTFSVGVDTR